MLFRKKSLPPAIDYPIYEKRWYFDFLDDFLGQFSKQSNTPSLELQNAFLYELSLRIKANANNKNLQLLDVNEVDKFWENVAKNLNYVQDSVINDYVDYYNSPLKHYLLTLKGSAHLKTTYTKNDITIKTKEGLLFTQASQRNVFIEMMSYDKATNHLTIMGCTTFPFDQKTTNLVASINGSDTHLPDTGLYSDYKIFGKTVYHKYPFRIDIDPAETLPIQLEFLLVNKQKKMRVPLNLHFNTKMSKLAGRITYWRFDKYMATHTRRIILIKAANRLEVLFREIAFLTAIATIWHRPRTAALRMMYWAVMPLLSRRNIWMYADKIYKAGDNAEWLYRYALQRNDDIHNYYVLRDDSPDAKIFKNDGIPYLKYKTIWQRLLFLHANIIVFTHNNAPGYYRFAKANEVYFRGLFNYDIMYIQHGLTVQDTAWLFNKSEDDFRRYYVASKFEKENLLRLAYGFKPDEIIEAGATRYDGLVNNDKKNIIITPTWRTYLAPPGKDYGESRDANQNFKDSNFYKIYTSIITNNKLISTAKKHNYSITYLLHPVMSSQIQDFPQDGYVNIVTANDDFNYQKAMTEASLMVTDYSGVQFDFAYMYKPVVYYHPPELPASYDEATYQYESHALGEIKTSMDDLIETMCMYIESGCTLQPEYRKRIDDFFYFHDHSNSKRIYEDIVNWQNQLLR